MLISIDDIDVNPTNVRTTYNFNHPDFADLCQSLSVNGLINPITVRPSADGRYVAVAGNSRLQAARALKWPSIECQVIDATDDKAFLIGLSENMHRSPMTFADRCRAIVRCHELCNKNVAEVARRVSMCKTTVRRYLAIASLDADVLEKLDARGDDRLTVDRAYRIARGENIVDESDDENAENDENADNAENDENAEDATIPENAANPASSKKREREPEPDNTTVPDDEPASKRKKSIKSEPWVFDPDNKPVQIPEDLYSRVYRLVRSSAK